MSEINASDYDRLSGYSGSGQLREAGPFVKVFISGQQRTDQEISKMHAIYSDLWKSSDVEEKYLFRNQTKVNFIILFIKKIRELKEKRGREYDELTYFSWTPDEDEYPAGAKCAYIVAGVLLDENYKPIPEKHLKEEEQPRTALIHFKNAGIKCGPFVEFLGRISDKAKELNPLSNNPDFEVSVVTPRRFITEVTIGKRPSNFGEKDVFDYKLVKQLPDDKVSGDDGVMKRCMKWVDPFDEQFNLSKTIGQKGSSDFKPDNKNPTFEDTNSKESDIEIKDNDFELGI